MASRFFTIGALAALTAMAAVATVSSLRHSHLRPAAAPGTAHLLAFGSRSLQQRRTATGAKFDGALADLSRHTALARADHAIEDLRSLAPAVRFKQISPGTTPLVLIDAVTRGDPEKLKAALVALGLQHPAIYSNDVGGWLPVTQLDAATARDEVHSIRAAMSRTRTGAVTSQGDFVQHSDVVRSANSLTGAGVTVGVLSDSYDCYAVYAANNVPAGGAAGYANNGFTATAATDISTGDLPSTVNVLQEADPQQGGCMNYGAPTQLPFGDEGRAMLQIVHDVAPGASLAFYTAEDSEADFANGIGTLAAPVASGGAGATVIADDVGYFDEPFFQDGILAQAIDAVEAQGVAYFSAAGNNGTLAYDSTTPSFNTVSTTAPNSGEHLLNFDASGTTTVTALPVTIAPLVPGEFVAIVVEWDQPYVTGAPNSGGATSHIDLCLTGASGTDEISTYSGNAATCSGPNQSGVDSYQIMIVANPANASGNTAAETLNIVVGLADGTAAPGRIKIAVEDDGAGSTINALATNSATLQGHPGAAGAAAVGAAFFLDAPACSGTPPATLESYSSEGGTPILFDASGTRLAVPVVRQKPDFVGPDGGNDTFLGFTLASQSITDSSSIAGCKNNPSYPNFFGTSAATPHAAGIAALMLQAKPSAAPAEIYQALQASALSMGIGTPSPNQQSGYGFIQADTAFVVPALTLGASTVAVGGSTTLTWSTINATSCVASGNWSGTLAANGSQTVTVSGPGANQYTLTCTNAAGTSASNSINLTAVAPPVPTLTLSANSIVLPNSATISWSASNAASCTASGSWSGPLPTSGSQLLTPSNAGPENYALTCSNAIGAAAATPVTLDVTAPPPPAAPKLTSTASSIVLGASMTLTWSSVSATSCTASGAWSGTMATSGTQTVTPTAAGTDTYTLTCSNAGGASSPSSVTLTVTSAAPPPASHSGGGALDVLTLLSLAGIGVARILRLRPRVLI